VTQHRADPQRTPLRDFNAAMLSRLGGQRAAGQAVRSPPALIDPAEAIHPFIETGPSFNLIYCNRHVSR
jgi:hypothetical protein